MSIKSLSKRASWQGKDAVQPANETEMTMGNRSLEKVERLHNKQLDQGSL